MVSRSFWPRCCFSCCYDPPGKFFGQAIANRSELGYTSDIAHRQKKTQKVPDLMPRKCRSDSTESVGSAGAADPGSPSRDGARDLNFLLLARMTAVPWHGHEAAAVGIDHGGRQDERGEQRAHGRTPEADAGAADVSTARCPCRAVCGRCGAKSQPVTMPRITQKMRVTVGVERGIGVADEEHRQKPAEEPVYGHSPGTAGTEASEPAPSLGEAEFFTGHRPGAKGSSFSPGIWGPSSQLRLGSPYTRRLVGGSGQGKRAGPFTFDRSTGTV